MRKIIVVLVITTCFIMQGFTQNYLTVKPNSIAYYQGTTNTNVFPIRIDSTRINGANTDYYSFCMIRPISGFIGMSSLATLKGEPWIGKKVEVNSGTGINLFFNKNHDTIVIKTNAHLSDTWRMFSFSNGDYIEAALSTFATESFLGLTDSVKTISLQLKNSLGTNLTDPINNLQLKLSKNYGFTLILDFYNFPYDPNSPTDIYQSDKNLTLIGLSNPMVGWQNITLSDVFDMQPNDEIHYYTGYTAGGYPNVIEDRYINRYLTVYFDTLTDSIHYTIERCGNTCQHMPTHTTTYYYDTINVAYLIDSTLNSLPFEPTFQNGNYCFYIKNDSIAYIDISNQYYYNNQYSLDTIIRDACLSDPTCGVFFKVYYKGLGYISKYFTNGNYTFGNQISSITYFNLHDSISWGTPYNCGLLLLSVANNVIAETELSIFPNPTNNGIVTINSSETIQNIAIFNNLGEKIISEDNINSKTTNVSTSKLSPGIYFIKVYCSNNLMYVNKLIINN